MDAHLTVTQKFNVSLWNGLGHCVLMATVEFHMSGIYSCPYLQECHRRNQNILLPSSIDLLVRGFGENPDKYMGSASSLWLLP